MVLFVLIIYGVFLSFIFFYSLIQLDLVIQYLRYRRHKKQRGTESAPVLKDEEAPVVTVQLPVFNEYYVVERLIDAVASFDYPKECLEIQVLDDSTDESVDVAAERIDHWQRKGLDIQHVRRTDRKGFKAGALAHGLSFAKGDFIAVFDADFIPPRNFLRKTLPAFKDDSVGVVQTRWEHINEHYSSLTRMQAFGLNAHFSVEQMGRNSGGHFMNFNGTAGVWRKACIDDAGGWMDDTLTEDLDLSYRAQLKGWRFVFREDTGAPAELPAAMNALKTQQFRWTKGAAECARKNLPKVLKTGNFSFRTKVHAIFHLMNSFLFICIFCISMLSIPVLFIKDLYPEYALLFKVGSFFIMSLVLLAVFYWTSLVRELSHTGQRALVFLKRFPMFLSVSMGMSLHNAVAVFEGYVGKRTSFIRTPKFNIKRVTDSWKGNKYRIKSIDLLTLLEGVITLYFFSGIWLAFHLGDFGLLPFHVMLTLGFGYVFYYSYKHTR